MDQREERGVQKLASELFLRRLGAYVVDMLVGFGLLALMEKLLGQGALSSDRSDLTRNILFSLFMLLAHWMFHGKSIGKTIFGLRVVRRDMHRAGLIPLIYREFVGRFLLEKSNLILIYFMNKTGALEALRAQVANPIADTLLVAAVSLPWVTFVSFAFALCRPDGRTIHDLVSDTMIVRG